MIRETLYLKQLMDNLNKKESAILELQFKKLKKLLIHAYKNTQFYNELFKKLNFNPNIKSIHDLRKLPVLTKSIVQDNYDKILIKGINKKKLFIHSTSGSSGRPLKVYNDSRAEAWNIALRYRSYFANGQRLTDKILDITSPEYLRLKSTIFQKLGILTKKRLSIYENEEDLIKKMNSYKPDIIQAYPSVLYLIAQNNYRLNFRPRVIFTSSELLSEKMRKTISEKFRCPVIDVYGSEEFNRLAWQCKKQEGYHLDIDCHVIEFLNNDNKPINEGEGRIVVTSLVNFAFPFIRYDIGDRAYIIKKRCGCYYSLPIIRSIQGREDDYLRLANGKIISPRRINIIENIPGIKQYQTIQLREDLFEVKVVRDKDFTNNTIKKIQSQIQKGCLGQRVTVNVKIVSNIPRSKSGKLKTVISRVR